MGRDEGVELHPQCSQRATLNLAHVRQQAWEKGLDPLQLVAFGTEGGKVGTINLCKQYYNAG